MAAATAAEVIQILAMRPIIVGVWEGLPIPCERQARLFESNGYKYSFIVPKEKKSDLVDSPLPKKGGGSSSALTYTAKPEDAPTKGRAVKPSSIPTEDPKEVMEEVTVYAPDDSLVDASEGLVNTEVGFRPFIPLPAPPGGNNNADKESQTGISQDCIDALKKLGVLKRVQNLLKTARLYDVDKIQNKRASQYFGGKRAANNQQSVGDYFDNREHNGNGATTIRGGGRTGIYYRSSRINLNQDIYLKLHETTHLAFPKTLPRLPGNRSTSLDEVLAKALNLEQQSDIEGGNQETFSEAVSRYFDSKCDPREQSGGRVRYLQQLGGNP